jgi:small neutral amino acid transporter SnatA (MarC family)
MLISFSINLVLLWVALGWALLVVRAIGEAGAQVMANVFGLLPAAIGVMLIPRRLELTLCAVHAGFCCRAELSHNVLSF